jgi:hypothetical protein
MRDRVEIQHDIRGGHWEQRENFGPIRGEIRDELYRYLAEMLPAFCGFHQVFIEFHGVREGRHGAVLVRQVSVDGLSRIRLL